MVVSFKDIRVERKLERSLVKVTEREGVGIREIMSGIRKRYLSYG